MIVCKNPNCEMENPEDVVFCKYCGRRLKESKATSKNVLKVIAGIAVLILLVMGAKAMFSGIGADKAKEADESKGAAQHPAGNGVRGYKFAFVRGTGSAKEVYFNNADGSVTKVTNSNAINQYPSLSPDASKITFVRKEGKVSNIYVVNSNGTEEKKLGEGQAPTWTNDGSSIVFYNKDPKSISNILYTIKPNGTGLKELLSSSSSYYMARYAPDGSKVAVAKSSIAGYGIYTATIKMEPGKTLLESKSKQDEPAWSADASKVAFYSEKDGNKEIYVVDANKNITRLTNNPLADFSPSWTPDGKVMFTREENGTANLYIVDADGKNEKLLVKDAAYGAAALK